MLPSVLAVLLTLSFPVYSKIAINVTSSNINGDVCYVPPALSRLSITCFSSQYMAGERLALVSKNGTVNHTEANVNSTEVDQPFMLHWSIENVDNRDEAIRTTYSCKHFDKNGTLLEHSGSVRVRAFQCFSFPNEVISGVTNEHKELRCLSSLKYQIESANVTYIWLVNHKVLYNKTTPNITIKVSEATAGVYHCVITFEDMYQQLWRQIEVYILQPPCFTPHTFFRISNSRVTKTPAVEPASQTWNVAWYEYPKDHFQAKPDRISLRHRQAESLQWSVPINLTQPSFDLQAVSGSLHELEITTENQAGTCKPERRFILIPESSLPAILHDSLEF